MIARIGWQTVLVVACLRLGRSDDLKAKPSVKTSLGFIKGRWLDDDVAVFQGIPFAKPPIGDLKFRKPQPPPPWDEPLNAAFFRPACQQLAPPSYPTSEDCLYLNVYSSLSKASSRREPVLVWFHGGNFEFGSAADYSPESHASFVLRGVVVVTVNYRLGFDGFFTTGTEAAPANLALWDQLAALEWVRREIGEFSGDPKRVTIGGHGSGAVCVSLHLRSAVSRRLFSKAILQSGCSKNPFALESNRYSLRTSRSVAVDLGCITERDWDKKRFSDEFLTCMRNISFEELHGIEDWKTSAKDPYKTLWAPRLADNELFEKGNDTTLTNLPILIGSVADEKLGALERPSPKSQSFDYHFEPLSGYNETSFDDAIALLASEDAFDSLQAGILRKLLKFSYTNDIPKQHAHPFEWIQAILRATSDYWMNVGISEEARKLTKSGADVYLYSFDYISSTGFASLPYPGVMHGAELLFLFPNNSRLLGQAGVTAWPFSETDIKLRENLINLWCNFIETGNPNSPKRTMNFSWNPLSNDWLGHYLSINETLNMRDEFHALGTRFWLELVPELWETFETSDKSTDFFDFSLEQFYAWTSGGLLILFLFTLSLLVFSVYRNCYQRKTLPYGRLQLNDREIGEEMHVF